MLRIGIDTGGTFTDFVVLEDDKVTVFKLPSTPNEPEKAVLEGISRIVKDREGYLLQHGSTVATNAFLERKGANCVLITNQGFEDVIEIGRQNRPGLFNLSASRPQPLVSVKNRIGVKERTAWDGSKLTALEEKSLEWMKGKVEQLKPESIAVVLLYSYENPENELRVAKALSGLRVPVSLSHQILPEFREYERTSTTVINAYVQPIMSRYLSALEKDELVKRGSLTVMQSNGGSISAMAASEEPVRTLFSGPAGGVVGAFEVAKLAGYEKILTLDMGGTSTDVCLCDGAIETTSESTIDHLPVSIQMIGIHTVGAGGGSIAWIDEGGLLKVGPRSAGAEPGPICYGRGTEVTVTDANVFLGRLDPEHFLGGEMKLFPEKISPALEELGKRLGGKEDGWKPEQIAEGIVRIVNGQMERALRVISLERGYDTRDFTLVTFGGAGALHACDLAQALLIPRILVPLNPGALSAAGILRADVVQDVSQTLVLNTREEKHIERAEDGFKKLEAEIRRKMKSQGFTGKSVEIQQSVDARYLGQSYEINVPFGPNVIEAFHKRHEAVYGYSNKGLPVELVNLRIRASARHALPALPQHEAGEALPPPDAVIGEKMVGYRGADHPTKFLKREHLLCGNRIIGPAVILEYGATTFVPRDFEAKVDPWLNLVIEPASKPRWRGRGRRGGDRRPR